MLSLPANSRRFYESRDNIFAISYFQFKTMQKFSFDKDEVSPFLEVPSADFIDILLQGGARADEAAYYLLHHRVNFQLRRCFEVYHSRLADDKSLQTWAGHSDAAFTRRQYMTAQEEQLQVVAAAFSSYLSAPM